MDFDSRLWLWLGLTRRYWQIVVAGGLLAAASVLGFQAWTAWRSPPLWRSDMLILLGDLNGWPVLSARLESRTMRAAFQMRARERVRVVPLNPLAWDGILRVEADSPEGDRAAPLVSFVVHVIEETLERGRLAEYVRLQKQVLALSRSEPTLASTLSAQTAAVGPWASPVLTVLDPPSAPTQSGPWTWYPVGVALGAGALLTVVGAGVWEWGMQMAPLPSSWIRHAGRVMTAPGLGQSPWFP